MFFHVAGILLLSLHTAESQGDAERPQYLARILASAGETVTVTCKIPDLFRKRTVSWSRRAQGKSLQQLEASTKYTMQKRKDQNNEQHLIINEVQSNDSGVYYCAADISGSFRIADGTRLMVREASGPSLSLLAPSSWEGALLSHGIPLLCLFYDGHPDWGTVSWDISGNTSEDQKDGDVIDGEGLFGIWSLKLIPAESWTEGASYTCSDPGNRNTSGLITISTVSTIAGNADQPGNRVCMHEIPQTDYAELRCNK
ncbi:immunoglobulin alpha-2 heavy chain-like isoform X2 [Hemicordylus capensis]|uniref:immunoglobulin alpha-2 heavy chain-like isoform X2 n=1 Tax=Hemicordylus capensis TaxID=884348 RepID=UPI00230341AC|nr:immunoglobulin alpha-2 heavy chain-like isoform X2 [Hemicordylus capensis]